MSSRPAKQLIVSPKSNGCVAVHAQAAKKRLPPPGHPLSAPGGDAGQPAAGGGEFISPEDYVAQDEVLKVPCLRGHPSLHRERDQQGHLNGVRSQRCGAGGQLECVQRLAHKI